jgi:hypothetical protein
VAELLEKELGVKPQVVKGNRGEFSVVVGDKTVAEKGLILFPSNKKVIEAVRRELSLA